jgi:rsbT antagonist protein RsbS
MPMRTPILKQDKTLIASVQGSLSDADLVQLRDDLALRVREYRTDAVIVDVTLLDVMDSFAARTFRGITQMTRLLGATAIVAGIQPEVAFAMVQLGLTLDGITTALDVEAALIMVTEDKHMADRLNGG